MNYCRPDKLENALSLLADGRWTILSGGTDVYPACGEGPLTGAILDISGLSALNTISEEENVWRIGALATWSEIIATPLPPAFDGLKLAAREIGSVQIQNWATVVGNICNASPAADGVPPLLTLDCAVEIQSISGTRVLPLSEFIQGNRSTALETSEMVTALLIPKTSTTGWSSFLKLGARKYLIISITMVAARLAHDKDGQIIDAALSVGACSLVAQRLPDLEMTLIGQNISDDLAALANVDHLAGLSPIDDIRAPAAYRLIASLELVKTAINTAANGEAA